MNGIGSVFAFVGVGLAACILAPDLAEGFNLMKPFINRDTLKKLHAK